MKLTRYILALVLLIALPALSACGTSKDDKSDTDKIEAEKKAELEKKKDKEIPICPHVAILRDLEDIKDFGTEKPDAAELVAQAKMLNVTGDCAYLDNGIDVRFDLNMIAAKGPRLGGLRAGFPYFAAVVAPDQTILSKEKMTAEFGFSSDKKIADHAESLHVFIPLAKDKRPTGPDYQVLLGFQLDENQLNALRTTAK